MAKAAGDVQRERALRALATADRHFLLFDGRGEGRAVEVLGDLATADRISVLVPGSDTTLDNVRRPVPPGSAGRRARSMSRSTARPLGPRSQWSPGSDTRRPRRSVRLC
ncbi:alpha/beta hydrolase [Streptomyces sp. NBC_01443]|uniref:alpha/beta hydrolase n=1 Tax=Streptomyces sp. NBC_01443 TaxID=2903868 RepID=UPI002B1CCAF8|nr:alpha/beta hydrolase [Streptomyces sp. NBC_01443]